MDIQFTQRNEDEIKSAAELHGMTPAEYVRNATLWVVFNCAEAGTSTPCGLYKDRPFMV